MVRDDGLPPRWMRHSIAKAVHDVVLEECLDSNVPVWATCSLYAETVASLASQLTDKRYYPFAGALVIQNDPRCDYLFVIDSDAPDAVEKLECHCWAARPIDDGRWEVVDLFSRHYRALFEKCISTPNEDARKLSPHWAIADTPEFIWDEATRLPAWLIFIPKHQIMERYGDQFVWTTEEIINRAWSRYKDLVGISGCVFGLN